MLAMKIESLPQGAQIIRIRLEHEKKNIVNKLKCE